MASSIDEELLISQLRPLIEARAAIALEGWKAWPRKQDIPLYPFARTENPEPEMDVTRSPRGYTLTIRGPQVDFFEHGNGPGLITPRRAPLLQIQLADGGFVGLTHVRPYEGERPWYNSVLAAFADL